MDHVGNGKIPMNSFSSIRAFVRELGSSCARLTEVLVSASAGRSVADDDEGAAVASMPAGRAGFFLPMCLRRKKKWEKKKDKNRKVA